MTMARKAASGLFDDYRYDEERQCWWASDERGRQYRFVVVRKSRRPTLRREMSLLRGFPHWLSILTLARFTMAKPHQQQAVMQ